MARSFWLIDGYNLMHAMHLARQRLAQGELEKRRDRFLNLIASRFTEEDRSRITIVFDARDKWIEGNREQTRDAMRLVFPEPHTDADSEIERLLAAHSAPRQLHVVSSDRRLQTAARRRGARPIASEAFERELNMRPAQSAEAAAGNASADESVEKPGTQSSDEERAYWLSVFAEAEKEIADSERERKAAEKTRKRPRR